MHGKLCMHVTDMQYAGHRRDPIQGKHTHTRAHRLAQNYLMPVLQVLCLNVVHFNASVFVGK